MLGSCEKVTCILESHIRNERCNDAAMKLRYLFLGRKIMTNLDSLLKSRHIALPTKVHLVKAMVFPVVKYGCENRTIKKAEHQRTYAFVFVVSKITADGDCSHEIKRCLLLGRKAMMNLDSTLKSRDIPLPTKSV